MSEPHFRTIERPDRERAPRRPGAVRPRTPRPLPYPTRRRQYLERAGRIEDLRAEGYRA